MREEYGKQSDNPTLAESWEISCHPDGRSLVANGPLAGETLAAALAAHPGWMGTACAEKREFPLMIKLIDARDRLSLQVHPSDEYALREEGQLGKNEMWYVMDALPGAELILGFSRPVDREELRRRITEDTLTEVTRRVPVEPGDCYCIPAGLLHAIGAGTLIAEIQQNSNVTYRVYDYGRRGADGKLRDLHVEKALDVIDSSLCALQATEPAFQEEGCIVTPLTGWSWFRTDLLEISGHSAFDCDNESFRCLMVVSGKLTIQGGKGEAHLCAGESAFLPAGLGAVALLGQASALLTRM